MSKSDRHEAHPLLTKLLERGPVNLVAIRGFVGPSDADVLRVYRDMEARQYVDIPRSALAHVDGDSTKGRVSVWVDACTELRCVEIRVRCCRPGGHGDSTEKGFSKETCDKLEALNNRVTKMIGDISSGQTPIDPESDLADEIIKQLIGILDDLGDLIVAGGCVGTAPWP